MTFEEILRQLEGLEPALNSGDRKVRWLDDGHRAGVATDPTGAYELFVRCELHEPQSRLVARHMMFDRWRASDGTVFEANRIILPSDSHFKAVTTFLAEELYRHEVVSDPKVALNKVEPLIEMALRSTTLDEESLLGLLGELRLLELLMRSSSTREQRIKLLECWRGYARSTHDFTFNSIQVEVKTTRGTESTHGINHIHQVDPKRTLSGQPEEQLYLLSIGFASASPVLPVLGTLSLPDQVETILTLLEESDREESSGLQKSFLDKVRLYGGQSGGAYDHDVMAVWPYYLARYSQSFLRLYDMNDEAVRVLRRADLDGTFVRPESVRFTLALPAKVTGDLNPETDVHRIVNSLLRALRDDG